MLALKRVQLGQLGHTRNKAVTTPHRGRKLCWSSKSYRTHVPPEQCRGALPVLYSYRIYSYKCEGSIARHSFLLHAQQTA